MKPPPSHSESAVPRTLHAQLEIAKAIRMPMAPDDDTPLRRRRAELAAMRGELETMKRDLHKASEECLALVKAALRAALAKKYNPDQARVPAGNRDGGQWTSGGGVGSEVYSPDLVVQPGATADDAPMPQTRYAALDTGTRNDAAANNATAASGPESGLGKPPFRISAYDIPGDSAKRPVPFLDSRGDPIVDAQGNSLLRPDDKPPEMFVREGLATRDVFSSMPRLGADALAAAMFVARASQFGQGGLWDAQRVDGHFVDEYRDYATITIGLYMAAGVSMRIALLVQNIYAWRNSTFDPEEKMDAVYSHLPLRSVRSTELGYELYRSGRISGRL
jgi:hypothetical protein